MRIPMADSNRLFLTPIIEVVASQWQATLLDVPPMEVTASR